MPGRLCAPWTVREVAGHLCDIGRQYHAYTLPIFTGIVRTGFRPNTFFDRGARKWAQAPPDALVEELRSRIDERRHPWPCFPLAETVIHGEDIRRAAGLHRRFPIDRLLVVAAALRRPEYPFLLHKPARRLRLVATDTDWARGHGPEVRGPLQELVMAMAGRPCSEQLTGPGVAVLAARRTTA